MEGGARVEEMCWGEGLEVVWVVAAGCEWASIDDSFNLDDECLEGADVERF